MTNNLSDLLGGALAPELVNQLQEAFDARIDAKRIEIEEDVRAEMGARFEHDKSALVEAMNNMITDGLTEQARDSRKAVMKADAASRKFAKGVNEAKAQYRAKLAEHVKATDTLVENALTGEVKSLNRAKHKTVATAQHLSEAVQQTKRKLAERHIRHVKEIDNFVREAVKIELTELAEDRKALAYNRAKLISEAKSKLSEAQSRFVTESAKSVDKFITEALTKELRQLHEDLEAARQNMFGRKLFEAFAAEYSGSYYADASEAAKWRTVAEAAETKLNEAATAEKALKNKLNEAKVEAEKSDRRVRLAEDRVERTKIMSELLSPLKGQKRAVMEEMLATTKTAALRTSYEKLLPAVLSEGDSRNTRATATPSRSVLSEGRERSRVINGDRKRSINETAQDDAENSEEMDHILHLAGRNG